MLESRHISLISVVVALGVLGVAAAAPLQAGAGGQIEVLIVTGGHSFDEQAFLAAFDSIGNVRYEHKRFGRGAETLLARESIDRYDVMVFYDMNNEYRSHRDAWLELLRAGQPTLFLHHALGANTDWAEYGNIVGARANFGPKPAPGVTTWKHDVEFKVHIADTAHPITRGLSDFTILDETYKNSFPVEDVHVLLTTEHESSDRVIGWTHKYEKSPIVYIQLGHGPSAYNNRHFRLLLENSIRWLARP